MTTYIGFEIEVENKEEQCNTDDLIEATRYITGWPANKSISCYHEEKTNSSEGLWRIERDSSIITGVEFVMPPLEKSEALSVLEKFFYHIEKVGCITTKECGLHMNMSHDNMELEGFDRAIFVSEINYNMIYNMWTNRLKGSNCNCVTITNIISKIANEAMFDHAPIKTVNQMLDKLFKNRYNMFNIRNEFNEPYIEIRVMGDTNYHKKIKGITQTTEMFANALDAACSNKHSNKKHKRIISYINRAQQKNALLACSLQSTRYLRPMGLLRILHKLMEIDKYEVEDIYGLLEKYMSTDNMFYKSETKIKMSHLNFEERMSFLMIEYCDRLIDLTSYIASEAHNSKYLFKLAAALNNALYYIAKYSDKNFKNGTADEIIRKVIKKKKAIVKKIRISQEDLNFWSNKSCAESVVPNKLLHIKLVIPEKETQFDTLWLAKHMHKFKPEKREKYLESISKPMIRYLSKYNYQAVGMKNMIKKTMKQISH